MARIMKIQTISLACMALIFIISMHRFHVSEAAGFSIDLIHRDSFQSSSLSSSSEQVKYALQRSFNRVKNLVGNQDYDSPQSASADIISDRGEYLMRLSLGTPPTETFAIADTGSDLTWVQCKPCIRCFQQNSPIFEPNRSSTYKTVPCTSPACTALHRASCDASKGACTYTMMYGDSSFSRGDVATDTITLGSKTGQKVSIPNVTLGCAHQSQGTFGAGSSGIVGLGGGKESLITQMGSSIEGKFSYCLVPFLGENKPNSSKLNFGDNAVVSGAGAVSTPIVAKLPKTFYFLTLEGITVGNHRLDVATSLSSSKNDSTMQLSQEGNIIIDSGTTLAFLPRELYYQLVTAVKSQMKLREVRDPMGLLNLCYLATGSDVAESVPEITAHFKGADVKLKSMNTFVRTSLTSVCLAFAPATTIAIYGNLAQMNFLVGYDLVKKTVSFKPTDCSTA